MRLIILTILIAVPILLSAQKTYTEEEINTICDSILIESETLYRFEKTAWIANDMAYEDTDIRNEFRAYIVYERNDSTFCVFLNEDKTCIATYAFFKNFDKTALADKTHRDLSTEENTLFEIREKILNQIIEEEYEVTFYENYDPNLILLPYENGYKFYIISGTSLNNIIPFGNDYIYFADNEGNIEQWRKFHSRLIPAETKDDKGRKIVSFIHSHLKTEPFITATDICTFRIYAELYDLNEFMVYSTALSKYFKYDMSKNTITVSDK